MLEDFYLTLPSSVIATSGDKNLTGKFRTLLPKSIDLKGEWQVGLSEILYPYSWNNIKTCHIFIRMLYKKRSIVFSVIVNKNYHDDIMRFTEILTKSIKIGMMNSAKALDKKYIGDNNNNVINFTGPLVSNDKFLRKADIKRYDKMGFNDAINFWYTYHTDRVTIHIEPNSFITKIELPESVARLLGFAKHDNFIILDKKNNIAPYPPDISGGIMSMHVYCDAVVPQLIGDKVAPLLRSVGLEICDYKYGSMIKATYSNPHYMPVRSNNIQTINIELLDDVENMLDFNYGTSIIVLHFRKVE